MKQSLSILLAIILMSSCFSPDEEIFKAFEIVDNSMANTNALLEKSTDEIISELELSLDKKDRKAMLSVVNQKNAILATMDSLVVTLNNTCMSEADLVVPERLFITEGNFTRLKASFGTYEELGVEFLGKKDSTFHGILNDIKNANQTDLFQSIPCVAGLTMIAKYRNELLNSWKRMLEVKVDTSAGHDK